MFNDEGPYTRAALRLLREFVPTMAVWLVAVVVWGWWTWADLTWLAIGWAGLLLPYLALYGRLYRRWIDEVERLDRGGE